MNVASLSLLFMAVLLWDSGEVWASARTCDGLFATPVRIEVLANEDALNIARSRATDAMALVLDSDLSTTNLNRRVVIDLVQDQSHIVTAPPIPEAELTILARQMFEVKFASIEVAEQSSATAPHLQKMWFETSNLEFRGQVSTLQAHTVIEVDSKDLATVLIMFVRSMYHPVLGNKVFKVDVIETNP